MQQDAIQIPTDRVKYITMGETPEKMATYLIKMLFIQQYEINGSFCCPKQNCNIHVVRTKHFIFEIWAFMKLSGGGSMESKQLHNINLITLARVKHMCPTRHHIKFVFSTWNINYSIFCVSSCLVA